MLSMSLYFRMRSLTVVEVSEGDAFTCGYKCQTVVSQPAEWALTLVNNQLDAQFFFMYVYFCSLHIFGQPCSHHQEN